MANNTIAISSGTIVRTILIFLLLGFLYLIKSVLVLFFVAIILASAFDPLIDWLKSKKIPRAVSIIVVYIVFLGLVGTLIFVLTGPITAQIKDLARSFPSFYFKVNETLRNFANINSLIPQNAVNTSLMEITRSLTQAGSGVFNVVSSVFGGVISFFMLLVITFYLTVEENGLKRFISSLLPTSQQPRVLRLIAVMQHRMGYWLRGQLLLSLIIFVMVYIGLTIIGIKYALILALLAGIFEIVPFLGPLLSAIPAVFFAFAQSPGRAIIVALLYLGIQQLENTLIVPRVVGKTSGLNPLVVILAILMGARLGGAIGALLAVPVALGISVYFNSFMDEKKQRDNKNVNV
jgi:predicted PurR-regulated permease PerM